MRKTFIYSLMLCTLVLLSACQTSESTEDTIKIGFVGPLTGDAASFGVDGLHAVQLRIDEYNAGNPEKKMVLIAEDGRCTGADAAASAQKLVHADRVAAIIAICSSEMLAIAPIAEASKTVLISPFASNPDITDSGDFVFRNYPSDAKKGKAYADYFLERGARRVALISESTDYCMGLRLSIQKFLPSGVELILDEIVEPGTKDYRSLATRLRSLDVDIVILNGQSDITIAAMILQLREQGMTQPAVSQEGADSATLAEIAGEAAEGLQLLNTSSVISDDNAVGRAFQRAFKEAYGDPQHSFGIVASSHDSIGVLLDAITIAGANSSAIRDYLYALPQYKGITGNFSFDKNGDVIGIPYVLKEFQGGKIVELKEVAID